MSLQPTGSAPSTFNPDEIPLTGWNLVEASAGTGKTYALAGLYVRLLIEKGLSAKEILVVTFTKAATEELKGRIRARIKDALAAFVHGSASDAFLKGLVSRVENHERARRLLLDALRSFDESAIFTIHGFCLRALRNHAFESGSLFNTELVEDDTDVINEVIRDFWRIKFYQASRQLFSCIRDRVEPGALFQLVRLCMRDPFQRMQRGSCAVEVTHEAAEQACLHLFLKASNSWEGSREIVREILSRDAGLSRNVYTEKAVDRVIRELDTYFSSGYFLPAPDALNFFCFDPPVRATAVKKQSRPPEHPLFRECELLRRQLSETISCYERKLMELREELIDFMKRESSKRKLDRNARTFNDLLLDLHTALIGERGEELAASLRNHYRAALIDEFQDTDPVQYAIFKKIYTHQTSTVYFIGDPKQAIFGFRGADLFAYLRASGDVAARFTLDTNWRSSEALIRAVNALFGGSQNAFLLEPLQYIPVKKSEAVLEELTIKGRVDPSPLKLWFLRRPADDKPLARGAARQVLYEMVCSEIGTLLQLGQRCEMLLGDRPVTPGDIAVIVRTNREAFDMQAALRQLNIPAVIYTGESVFVSDEARELEQILQAVCDPSDEGKVKVALVTRMFGLSGDDLARVTEDEAQWDMRLAAFDEYRLLWSRSGFISMARTLVAREQVKRRLASFPDGERRVTDLLHLVELLHRASVEEKLGQDGLLRWLGERRQLIGDIAPEEHQVRLETDERAIRIVTVHKSKGLEYPIVFCPFLWGDSSFTQPVLTYHPEEENYQSVVDLSIDPDERARECARAEQLAENIRLIYVALTRAKSRCYTSWGCINKAETSALAYLLHGEAREPSNLTQLEAHIRSGSDRVLLDELGAIVARSKGAIEILPLSGEKHLFHDTAHPSSQLLHYMTFTGEIEQKWRVSSFSALTSGKEDAADLPDRDRRLQEEIFVTEETESVLIPEQRSIFAFPAGATAGSCLHDIFERLDFACFESDETRALVSGMLNRYGFGADWADTLCSLIGNVLTKRLEKNGSFTLSTLTRSDRLNELEFHLPLSLITPKGLGALFTSQPVLRQGAMGSLIGKLGFKPVKGMLKGFIDMVFRRDHRYYIVDWKSNYLGPSPGDYGTEKLRNVMEREFYTLQYHVYALALHRFLKLRIPDYAYDTDFGGVYYLFLRGINPAGSHGILFERPAADFMGLLEEYVTGR